MSRPGYYDATPKNWGNDWYNKPTSAMKRRLRRHYAKAARRLRRQMVNMNTPEYLRLKRCARNG